MTAPNERRIKLTLHYDGSGFFGWQVQPGIRTVQSDLEAALSRLANRPISVVAAGRTDRGVHATGQVASALVPGKWTPDSLRRSLNAILPGDVWVADAEAVSPEFHARYDAVAREYLYRIGTAPASSSPFHRRWCWPLRDRVERSLLDAAAASIRGEHSFRAFAKSGQPERGERSVVQRADWREWDGLGLELRIRANRFLHHMVRYLVGTMVDIARGRRPVADMDALLAGKEGLETSPPAPPVGLFLARLDYSYEDIEREDT
ncbi:MAG: tRNA pseudouridine(38-40) synthase TruA [Gemmatimonadota bacterium]